MRSALRWSVMGAFVAGQAVVAQTRTLVRDPSTMLRPLAAPIATTTLSAMGGSGSLGNVVINAHAQHVHVGMAPQIGGVGEMMMTAPLPGAGVPGSRLAIQSAGPLPAGNYVVAIGFAHGKAGSVRLTDSNTGAVLTTCALAQGGWNDQQTCSAGFAHSGPLLVVVEPTAGPQLYPAQITVSQMP